MWEEVLIFTLIYLGIFFLILHHFKGKLFSKRWLMLTAGVTCSLYAAGVYSIYLSKQNAPVKEGFFLGSQSCGTSREECEDPKGFCMINEQDITKTDFDQTVLFNIYGRYVRVYCSAGGGDGYFSVAQLVIKDETGTNIGLGKTVTATSTAAGYAAPSKVVDGTLTARKDKEAWQNANNLKRDTEFLQVDLGSTKMVTSIRYMARSDRYETVGIEKKDPDRVTGVRIVVLQNLTDPVTSTGMCVATPTVVYPPGTTVDEQKIIKDMILRGLDGKKALNIYRGLQSNKFPITLTTYGLTDSQSAAAYMKMLGDNITFLRDGWTFTAKWDANSNIITVTNGVPPSVGMIYSKPTIPGAEASFFSIPDSATITNVSGNTITINNKTTGASPNPMVIKFKGSMNNTTYADMMDSIKSVTTMADITSKGMDPSSIISKWMSYRIKDLPVAAQNTDGIVTGVANTVRENGAIAATGVIMEKTKELVGPAGAGNQALIPTTLQTPVDSSVMNTQQINAIPAQPTSGVDLAPKPLIVDPTNPTAELPQATPVNIGVSDIPPDIVAGGGLTAVKDADITQMDPVMAAVLKLGSGSLREVFFVDASYQDATEALGRKAYVTDAGRDEINSTRRLVSGGLVSADFVNTVTEMYTVPASGCVKYNAVLATTSQLNKAYNDGARWDKFGYVSDSPKLQKPTKNGLESIEREKYSGTAGAICYGIKPGSGTDSQILPFNNLSNPISWNSAATLNPCKPNQTQQTCEGKSICLDIGVSCVRPECPAGSYRKDDKCVN